MKVLIWIASFVVYEVLNAIFGLLTGFRFGYLITLFVPILVARQLCKIYDEKREQRSDKKKKINERKLCLSCGAELQPNAVFCNSCGTRVKTEESVNIPKKTNNTQQNKNETWKCSSCGTVNLSGNEKCWNCSNPNELVRIQHSKPNNYLSTREETTIATDKTDGKSFFFENAAEFSTYISVFKPQTNITWVDSSKYIEKYKSGYELIEKGQYEEAVKELKLSLVFNPIGIKARFEICEAYLRMNNLYNALSIIISMTNFLIDKADKAKYYRRLGYIYTEYKDYKTAAACYLYSKNYMPDASADNELYFISTLDPSTVRIKNPEELLSLKNIPFLQL